MLGVSKLQTTQITLISFFFPFPAMKPGFAALTGSTLTVYQHSPNNLENGDNSEAEGSDDFRTVFAASQINTPLTLPVFPRGDALRQKSNVHGNVCSDRISY